MTDFGINDVILTRVIKGVMDTLICCIQNEEVCVWDWLF